MLIPIVFLLINISEYFSVYGDSDSTSINPDDLLPPIHKLEKYAESDNIFNRYEMVHERNQGNGDPTLLVHCLY
jgi:hypothetical protein